MGATQWWVFDRPLHRDPLFVAGVVLGLAFLVLTVVNRDDYGAGALAFTIATAFPSGVLAVGVMAGSIREFVRGRGPAR